MVKAQASE